MKHFDGRIIALIGETSAPFLQELIKFDRVETIIVPDTKDDKVVQQHWSSRWRSLQFVDADEFLHFDCDNIVVDKLDVFFDNIHTQEDYVTAFHFLHLGNKGARTKQLLNVYKNKGIEITGEHCYMEFGVVGLRQGWPHFQKVSDFCKVLKDDQQAMAVTLMQNGRKVYKPNLGHRPFKLARNYYRMKTKKHFETKVWHANYGYGFFWREFLQARRDKFLNLHDNIYIKRVNKPVFDIIKAGNWPNKIAKEEFNI
jgi:hypothetical protein